MASKANVLVSSDRLEVVVENPSVKVTDTGNLSYSSGNRCMCDAADADNGDADIVDAVAQATVYFPARAADVLRLHTPAEIRERFPAIRTAAAEKRKNGRPAQCWILAYGVVTGAEPDPREPEAVENRGDATPYVDAETRNKLAERYNVVATPADNGKATNRVGSLL